MHRLFTSTVLIVGLAGPIHAASISVLDGNGSLDLIAPQKQADHAVQGGASKDVFKSNDFLDLGLKPSKSGSVKSVLPTPLQPKSGFATSIAQD